MPSSSSHAKRLTFDFPFELSVFLVFFDPTSESSSEALITAAEEIGF